MNPPSPDAYVQLETPPVVIQEKQESLQSSPILDRQRALLIHAAQQPYTLVTDHLVPAILKDGEILVKVVAIGLNPVDWKGPAFNFGLPSLPWINGRDLTGIVVRGFDPSGRVRTGDLVLVPSTDYRDIRKAAFQEYAITTASNAARIPSATCSQAAASLGVAFVAAVLSLGVSLGLDLSAIDALPGPDLINTLKGVDENEIPVDVRGECFSASEDADRIRKGDWLAIWGASTTTGFITLQLAKLAGLRVICVADVARHGAKLLELGADLLVDRQDPERAVQIIQGVTNNNLRYAIDIVGRETATLLQRTLANSERAHLLGYAGLPKEQLENIKYHNIPVKLFHSSPAVGEQMVCWLEGLMQSKLLNLPDIVQAQGGLGGINAALELLRSGSVGGKRVVVNLD
ncbi:zinc-binding alcohol dehydrogenase family protein [Aspergillus glaucus CBS 516.65]|uniref:Uncharacterized protein n=1 Tax=Aspergillus glaucus CBS 516.65 TaxID=1160497 RepID=A0A1L9VEP9_ASPGL|nr:hypothetical protein ASPGLDRAFT_130359 [Aspergillus glaucus CBS 516.65]OJJ82365.1 hypothetical protein ASPGLDRAFT_130359 [Aspergillus glaucus CBS 516.65]